MLPDPCLSVCPVCDVSVLWIVAKRLMPLGMEVGLEAGHWPRSVRWGPSSPPKRGIVPPTFGPCLLWSPGWMDQDATWYGGK